MAKKDTDFELFQILSSYVKYEKKFNLNTFYKIIKNLSFGSQTKIYAIMDQQMGSFFLGIKKQYKS